MVLQAKIPSNSHQVVAWQRKTNMIPQGVMNPTLKKNKTVWWYIASSQQELEGLAPVLVKNM